MPGIIRRTVTLFAAVVLSYIAAKHNWLSHDFGSFNRIIMLVALIIGVPIFVRLVIKHSSWGTLLASAMAIGAYLWFSHEFHFKTDLGIVVVVAAALLIWTFNSLEPGFHSVNNALAKIGLGRDS
jgi:peptidoglycan/LPS O-acetylase OafA/YrhL